MTWWKVFDENYSNSTVHHGIEQGKGRKASFTAAIISARSGEDGNYRCKKEENDLRDTMAQESAEHCW